MKKLLVVICVTVLAGVGTVARGQTRAEMYPNMYEEKPHTILIMPPINRSTKVQAKELFYSTLVIPLTDKGYYVMPPLLTMEILKEESAYDAEMFLDSSLKRMGESFGVDAVLFTVIHEWTKATVIGYVEVRIEYIMKSAKTDEILFRRSGTVIYSPQIDSDNLLGSMVSNMVASAMQKEINMGKQCNSYTFGDLPQGKYGPNWGQDGGVSTGGSNFSITLK